MAKILEHTVFSTKERRPFLRDTALRQELHHYLGGILKKLDCQPVIVGGVDDHVHLLASLSRTCTAAEMVKEIKRGSSLWVKERDAGMQDYGWHNGYGMFSRCNPFRVDPSARRTPRVARASQPWAE